MANYTSEVLQIGTGLATGNPLPIVTGVVSGLGKLFGGGSDPQADAAAAAARQQQANADRAFEFQNKAYNEQMARSQPLYNASTAAIGDLQEAVKYKPFDYNAYTQDPSYNFRLQRGKSGIIDNMSDEGGLDSGANQKALMEYNQNFASQEYQNAFNRYQTERTARIAPLQSLVGVGVTANNQTAATGMNYANNSGQYAMANGNAQASAINSAANVNAQNGVNNTNALNQYLQKAGNSGAFDKAINYVSNAFTGGSGSSGGSSGGMSYVDGTYN
jgi:hypothetical protein